MTSISDFTDTELWAARSAKRYGKGVDLPLVDSELRLDPASPALSEDPTLSDPSAARISLFPRSAKQIPQSIFFSVRAQYGTRRDCLAECDTALFASAGHERVPNYESKT